MEIRLSVDEVREIESSLSCPQFDAQAHCVEMEDKVIALYKAIDHNEDYSEYQTRHKQLIAKSLHLIGDDYYQKQEYPLAFEFYQHALLCKMKIEYDDDEMIRVTQNCLLRALGQIRDKSLALMLMQKLHEVLTDKTQSFLTPCEDLMLVINDMIDIATKENERNDISLKQIGSHSMMFNVNQINMARRNGDFKMMRVKLGG